jgi:hypothetical protein
MPQSTEWTLQNAQCDTADVRIDARFSSDNPLLKMCAADIKTAAVELR